jgi:hypothetical protein
LEKLSLLLIVNGRLERDGKIKRGSVELFEVEDEEVIED